MWIGYRLLFNRRSSGFTSTEVRPKKTEVQQVTKQCRRKKQTTTLQLTKSSFNAARKRNAVFNVEGGKGQSRGGGKK